MYIHSILYVIFVINSYEIDHGSFIQEIRLSFKDIKDIKNEVCVSLLYLTLGGIIYEEDSFINLRISISI